MPKMVDAALHAPSPARAPRALIERTFGAFAILVAGLVVARLALVSATPLPLSVDEAQYWVWAQSPAWGYFSKPPLIAWLIAVTTGLCGDGVACVRAAAPVLHGLTALAVFALGAMLADRRVGWWAGICYALLPGVGVSSFIISTDAPLLLAWTLALICLVRALGTGLWVWWAGLGLAVGVGLLAKYAMAFYVLGLVVFAGVCPQARRRLRAPGPALAAALAALVVAPNVAWNLANGWSTLRHTGDNIGLSFATFNPIGAAEFLAGQFGLMGPVLFAVFLATAVAALGRASRARWDEADALLLSFSLPILALILLEALIVRAHANWAATAYVAAVVFVCRRLLTTDGGAWLRAGLAVNFALSAALFALVVADGMGASPPARLDPARKLRAWDQAGPWLRDLRHRHPGAVPLFDSRTDMAALMHAARPDAFDAVMWNPSGGVHNHFELVTDPNDRVGGDFIYINRHGGLVGVADLFAEAVPLAHWRASAYPGHELALHAYLLKGFKGYRR
ncbi:MAG: glycosyltransferase family 39 protein [Rhodospirillaceae bacterium]|nr:glycosyltransferase family 39 protein [Rhodospirillaceae bacterium]